MVQMTRNLLIMACFAMTANSAFADGLRNYLLQVADKRASGQYVREAFLKQLKMPFKDSSTKNVLIIGDSHAQDFFNSVRESGYWKNYQLSTRYIPTRCQIFLGEKGKQYIVPRDKVFCAEADSLHKARAQISEADIVILAANWKDWSAALLPSTLSQLHLKPQQKLFILGRKNFGKVRIRKLLRMSEATLSTLKNPVDDQQVAINQRLRKTLPPSIFIDQQQLICGEEDSCTVFTPEMKLISFDGGHLTKDGAKYVGRLLFQKSVLGKL